MKIVTVIGTRPQFIKSSALTKIIKKQRKIDEIIIDTGQHYDHQMSSIFLKDLNIPKPKYNLKIKSNYHGEMTGKMIEGIEKILLKEKPDYTIVYGDTNSTLAGAVASKKLHIPVIHIEAGLRSHNKKMPEEVNRILTDHCSDILFTPSKLAQQNLIDEGFKKNSIINVGDIMYDVFLSKSKNLKENFTHYDILVTIHRAENTNSKSKILNIIRNLNKLSNEYNIIFPVHPRAKKVMEKYKIFKLLSKKIKLTKPLSYNQSITYLRNSKLLITDSGGMQKEAFYAKTQTLTIRDETEWPETVIAKWNRLVEPKKNLIYDSVKKYINSKGNSSKPYGYGKTSMIILDKLNNYNHENKN